MELPFYNAQRGGSFRVLKRLWCHKRPFLVKGGKCVELFSSL
jgi:hypothetical protein